MNDPRNFKNGNGDESLGTPITDELDGLLRDWHVENADAAKAGRDRLLAALRVSSLDESTDPVAPAAMMAADTHIKASPASADAVRQGFRNWRAFAARFTPAAAAIVLIAILIAFNPSRQRRSYADVIYAPDGGALTAVDAYGRTRGPCPLKDTYVDVDISGRFARVTLWQTFHNPYNDKIEAVYTFPMSHNGAVDRMTMSIGERIIIGEVHERQRAKDIYETAKQQGHVAALLEQERPNIFTQSVANIEPGAEILVEISYIETLTPRNGLCEFAFPMVVAPRFIPGSDDKPLGDAARFATRREGVNLLAPGEIEVVESNEEVDDGFLWSILDAAVPIEITNESAWQFDAGGQPTSAVATFKADYDALADEPGAIYSNGTGQINGRWFAFDRKALTRGTKAVPDASRITPPVAPPDTRAGHDIAISVSLDTGGPGITEIDTPLHDTTITSDAYNNAGLVTRTNVELTNQTDIPNRDFVLRWRIESDDITDAVLTHTGDLGNFVTIMLDPPARVEADDLVRREIVFVIDTSGSMKGEPLNKAKQVMSQALEAMGPNDTFNVIAFSDDATPLWSNPREATLDNIDEAHAFVANHESKGGTQMMQAVRMALAGTAAKSVSVPTDHDAISPSDAESLLANGQYVSIKVNRSDLIALRPEFDGDPYTVAIKTSEEGNLYVSGLQQPIDSLNDNEDYLVKGWLRSDGDGLPFVELDEFGPVNRSGVISPARLHHLLPDNRRVRLLVRCEAIDGFTDRATGEWIEGVSISNDEFVRFEGFRIHQHDDASAMILTGRWTGGEETPRFIVESAIHVPREWTDPSPMRVVCFLTDGEVGNDMSIIDEIRNTADKTRFFSLGISNSVNRYLLDGMAEAGRGVGDVILLEDDARAAVQRFVQRMKAPVLLSPTIEFSDGLDIIDMQPDKLPDLFDERPIVIHARYETPGEGTIMIRGDAADGPFARTINVELPEYEPRHESLPTLWARAKVDAIMNRDLRAAQRSHFPADWRQEVVELGETFQIMTQYTSFVAVERLNVTYGGQPVRIEVPVELPDGMAPEGEIARQLMINAENYESWPQRVDQEVTRLRELQEFAAVMDAFAQHDQAIGKEWDGHDSKTPGSDSDAAASRGDTVDSPDYEANSAARKALKARAPLIRFNALPLDVVLDMLSKEASLEIAPDWSALGALAIDKNAEVSLQLTDVSFGKALELILDEAGGGEVNLGYAIQDGVIRILPKEELERRKAFRLAETQRLLASIQPFSEQDRTPTTSEEVNDPNAVTNIRELEKEIRLDVIKGNFEDAFRKLDVARQTTQSNRRNASLASRYDDFRQQLQDLERFIEDEHRAYGENAIWYQTEDISRIQQDKITRIQETKARRVDELVARASELRTEGRLDESIQVLDQVLQIKPDHEQAQWMHNTLGNLAQSIRDRESVLMRQSESRDVLIENDPSGIPYHENTTYPRNWPEIAARRQSPEELGTAVIDSNLDGSIGRITTDDIDAGVPILSKTPVLKEIVASKEKQGFRSVNLESFANGGGTNKRSDMEIRTPTGTLSKKGTDIFRVEETNGQYRMVLSEEGRRIIAQCQMDRSLGQQAGNADNRTGSALDQLTPAPDGSLIIECLEVSDVRPPFDRFLPERIEIRGSHPTDQFGRTHTADTISVMSSLEEPTVLFGAKNGDAGFAARRPGVATDSNVEFCYDSGGQRSRGVAPASKQSTPQPSGNLPWWSVTRANSDTPNQFVAPPFAPVQFQDDGTDAEEPTNPFGDDSTSEMTLAIENATPALGDMPALRRFVIMSAGRDGRFGTAGNNANREGLDPDFTRNSFPSERFEAESPTTENDNRRSGGMTNSYFMDARDSFYGVNLDMGISGASSTIQGNTSVPKNEGSRIRAVTRVNNLTPEQARELVEKLKHQSRPDSNSKSKTREPTDSADTVFIGGRLAGARFQGFDGAPAAPDRAVASTEMRPSIPPTPLPEDSDEEALSSKSRRESRFDDKQSTARHSQKDTDTAIKTASKATNIFRLETPIEDRPVCSFWNFGVEAGATHELDLSIPVWSRRVPNIEFNTISMNWILDCLGETVGTEFTFDANAIRSAGYACELFVTGHFEAGTLSEALSTLLEIVARDREPLDFLATKDGIVITTQSVADRKLGLVTARHKVADFLAVGDLPATVRDNCDEPGDASPPPQWLMSWFIADLVKANPVSHGGKIRSSVRFHEDNVIITHTPEFHRRIADWLAALRAARFATPSSAADVYRVAAGLRAGTHNADDVLAMLNAYPNDTLARQLLDATLAQHANIVGPPPPLECVMAMAANELRAAATRTKRISTCIDEPLLAMMAGANVASENSILGNQENAARSSLHGKPSSNKRAAPQPHRGRNGVAVSVLLADVTSATLDALSQSGLKIESVAATANVAVGNIPLSRLADLASLTNVRRIEAAQFRVPDSSPRRPRFRAAATPRRSQSQATLR